MPIKPRPLSTQEISVLPAGFTSQFDISSVRFLDRAHNPFVRNKILCRGYDLYWQKAPTNFAFESLIIQSLLMHELCHVWQYETGRLSAFRYLTNPQNWYYNYYVEAEATFDTYPIEKQADLLQDWFLVNSGMMAQRYDQKGPPPSKDWINAMVK